MKILRIYASIDASQEFDMAKLPARVVQDEGRVVVFQDFTGGLSVAEIQNVAYTLVHNIANLEDHLRRWARQNGKDANKVTDVVQASHSLKLIKDLSNNDKHPYPPRNGGWSRVSPKVIDIGRVMRLTTGEGAGSSIAMTLGPRGEPKITSRGGGSGRTVITGKIVDRDENRIGDLYDTALEAVEAWETLLAQLGVSVNDSAIGSGGQPSRTP